ncbi:MAG TPA: fibronectin type III domain-containing protein [Verrucomicrobiae bacterium]
MATQHTYIRSILGVISQGFGRGVVRTALLVIAVLVLTSVRAQAQTPTISPAAQKAHAQITAYNGPATCIACHQRQAQEMFGSVHYQEMAETPGVANIDGPAGKGRNGAMVMNSYCGTPTTSSRATCATCHTGNGRIPSTQITAEQLVNIDCMMCHQDAYKRVPAPPYVQVSFPGTNGTTHTINAVVEDETGFDFVPDTAKMTISLLQAAQTVHLPTRASCLRCHAGAGGSDGGKRGDISTVTANPPLTSDVHMSPQGANLACANCHSAGGHRVMGRGVDLRPNDSTNHFSCASCHTERPHGDYNARVGTTRDVHAGHVACQSCHIPAYAKDKSTEMRRTWLHAEFSMAACRGQGGWLPGEVRASNVIPSYQWFDGTSLANVLGQVPVENARGEYVLALPNGSVQTPNSKLFPMKLHYSDAAVHDATGLLIPHSTWKFFTSGDFSAAVAEGQALSNLEGPASVLPVMEYQTINHGVEPSANALQCGACHSAYAAGGPVRMNLKADLGYALKGAMTAVCSQCHGNKNSKGFAWVHDYHVRGKGYDCSSCHDFSRPERGLTRISAIKPAAPSGPVATTVSSSAVKLVWADNSTTEQGFRIERSLDGVNFAEIRTVGSNITTLTDSGLTAGTPYFYRVRAYNASGTSEYSMIGRANAAAPQPQPPPAPTGLAASAGNARVTLTWNASSGATSYNVKRGTVAGAYVTLATGVSATSYADTSAVNGTTYFYVVSAVNAGGESANSSAASATPQVAAPAAPTGLMTTAVDARVKLAWNASTGATSYNVKRATSANGPFTTIVAGITKPSYNDTPPPGASTYYYVVSAVNAGGESPNSPAVSVTMPDSATPMAPTGLKAEAGDGGKMKLTWNQSTSPNIVGNKVYRSTTSGGDYALIASVSARKSYTDSGLSRGKTYYYAVTALDASGRESAYSQPTSAKAR